MASNQEVALIVNQDAGKVASKMKILRKLARQHDLRLKFCDGPDLDYTLRRALENKKLKRIIIGGGDGSVSLAASLVYRTRPNIEIAVLPVGTANFYAKSLGVSRNLAKAFTVALGDEVTKRHICQANKRDFLIGVNIGATSRMFGEVTDDEKQRFGKIAYFRGVFRTLMKTKPPDVTIKANGKSFSYASTELVVLNQNIQGSLHLLPEVDGAQPYFEIITYGLGKSKLSPLFAVAIFALTLGRNQKYLKRIRTTKATIMTDKSQPVAIDGDSLEKTPLEVTLVKKPISFVCS
jgi:diacylglycerol kinase family enzyme